MTIPGNNEAEATDATGSAAEDVKLVSSRLGPYTVTIRLTATDRFVDVVSIQVDKDFRSTRERIRGTGFHDVSDFYENKEQ